MPRFIVGWDGVDYTVLFENWKDGKTEWIAIARCPSREFAREICEALRYVRDEDKGWQ